MSRPAARGSRTAARRRSAPTARRASPRSTGCRSTSTSSTRPIRGRRGEPPCARWPDSSTTASCGASGSRTSTAASWTRRSSSPRSRPSRSRSASSTTARSAAASSSAAPSRGSPSSPTRRSAGRAGRAASLAGGAGRGRGRARRDPGRGRARLAARPLPGRRRDSRRAAAGDRALGRPRRAARARGRGPRRPRPRVRRPGAAPPPRRERRADAEVVVVMGIPGAGKSRVAEEYVARGYLRLNRDERGGSLRELAEALDEALVVGRPAGCARQHLPHARGAELCDRVGEPARGLRALRLARHAARPGAGQPRRAAARPLRLAADARGAAGAGAARAGRARADLADAHAARARAAVDGRGLRRGGAGAVRRAQPSEGARAGVFVAAAALRHRLAAPPAAERDAPHLVFDWSPDGTPTRSPPTRPGSRPRSPGRSRPRSARTPAGRRSAGAGRRCPACRSPSPELTASTRRARS